jgi:NADH:ubiquinone oxidoreductase subunit
MAKKRMRRVRRAWSKDDIKELKAHSRAKTPVIKIAKETKRSALALRQKAWQLGIALGHRR